MTNLGKTSEKLRRIIRQQQRCLKIITVTASIITSFAH